MCFFPIVGADLAGGCGPGGAGVPGSSLGALLHLGQQDVVKSVAQITARADG